ncbi:hypothetical protein [uncultured Tateyamaria sp.]|uniref:hypothetical protein n=1 Tax=uncultured Tateyamaria sp. TaxID=455651 RepID=UPI00261EE157|nr:hypothetical protein [uncultured Tateyamaria sp.]
MFRLIYRQRRRHLFAGFFAILSCVSFLLQPGTLPYFASEPMILLVLTIGLTSVIAAICMMLISVVLVVVVPSMRMAVEFFSIMLFLNIALFDHLPLWITDRGLEVGVWIAAYITLFSITYGTWLDRYRIWLDHSETRRFRIKGTAEELWDWLVPGLDRKGGANWEPLLKKMEERADEPNVFDVEYRIGHAQFEHQTIKYEAVSYPRHARYAFQGELNPANKHLVSGIMEFTIDPIADTDHCKITLTRSRQALLVREGLLMWFDDALGDQVDHLRATWTDRWDWSMAGKFRRQAAALS